MRLFTGNRDGGELCFTKSNLDSVAMAAIGTAICEKYKKSKSASLLKYLNDAQTKSEDASALLLALFEQYQREAPLTVKGSDLYQECSIVYARERNVVLQFPSIEETTVVQNSVKRAYKCIERGDYDSALTQCRTLLEETFINLLERKGIQPTSAGNIKNLFKQFKNNYATHINSGLDKRAKILLSGVETIVDSISEMRNKNSDAHGHGSFSPEIPKYYALFCVNAAVSAAEFLLSVGEANLSNNCNECTDDILKLLLQEECK